MTLSEKLKRACHKSGETRYQLATEAGLDYASLHRFLDGKTGLNSTSMDKLADSLGYELVKKKGK
jgi:DNA transposition AAA+ family ATPase